MAKHLHPVIFIMCILFFVNGFSQKVFYNEGVKNWRQNTPVGKLVNQVFLIGDVKHPATDSIVVDLLKAHLDNAYIESSLFILGDIVYPNGIPDKDDNDYETAVADINVMLRKTGGYAGNIVFLPGNHDWNNGHEGGLEHLKNMQVYIQDYYGRDNVFIPVNGCPGPVEVPLSNDITAIVLDTQWWFQKTEKPGANDGCGFEDESDIFRQIEDIIRRNKGKKIILACHHPISSVGNHGGYFKADRLLFPLLDVNKAMYIPLPGFLYTGYRKYFGNIQDLAHPEYKILINKLKNAFKGYPDIIYTAGHEHNLQYAHIDNIHQVISGGGGEGLYISKRAKKTDFAMQSCGISVLNFYDNGDVWVEYYIPGKEKTGQLVFRKKLFNAPVYKPKVPEEELVVMDFSDSTVNVKLTDIYQKNDFVKFWMGDNYRNIWATEVELPVFNISKEKGGLDILKRGGGQQTRSVRMEDSLGRQYVLRSVNKYVEKAIDEEMRNTIAEDAVQDAISASHPFAAVTVPKMADAANIMHTNPVIVWVPDDPHLGIYRKDLANNIFLYEERPAGNCDDINSFGNSKKIINSMKVIDKTEDKHSYIIDQMAVLNARLFDMFLNDWDRHDDQWRWASFKEKGKKVYKPVPRDRDQVYFVNEGIALWIASRNFIMPKFQGFNYNIENVKGLGFNARYFDRYFITQPDLNDWITTAHILQQNLTDSVIHSAVMEMPPEVYEISGNEIEEKLKARRDKLDIYAKEYFAFLSKEVDILGTNKRELFEVNRLPNGNTDVIVIALSDKKGKLKDTIYKRMFVRNQTDEIRLYGLKGKDKFVINGEADKAIDVRIIPGKNNDTVIDNSKIKGCGKTVRVYDRKDKKNYFDKGNESKLILSNNKNIDDYNRKQYKYDRTMPVLKGGYNIDDGVYAGGGVKIKKYNFRDSTIHKITGTVAFQTGAFSLNYYGLISSFSQYFDLEMIVSLSVPRNVDNYFGLGNNTEMINDSKSYYRVRYSYGIINPVLKHAVNDAINYKIGTMYQYFRVKDTANKFVGNMNVNGIDSTAFDDQNYVGLTAEFEIDTRYPEVLPQRGMHFVTSLKGFYNLDYNDKSHVRLMSDVSFYLSFNRDPRVVFALRFGGAANIGNYEFYHANALGGKTNLRGFRSRRFAGDSYVYQNTEIRIKLLNLRNYLFNGQTGIFAFNDVGRVWYNNEESKRWHDGYGFGIWLTPYEFTALSVSYNMSDEDNMLVFNFSFLF